jgi:hypothetical protein
MFNLFCKKHHKEDERRSESGVRFTLKFEFSQAQVIRAFLLIWTTIIAGTSFAAYARFLNPPAPPDKPLIPHVQKYDR